MKKILDNKTLLFLIALILGAVAMDYYNFIQAKKLNYTKRSGLFTYNEITL